MQVRVVNSYAAASELVPVSSVSREDLPTEGKPAAQQVKLSMQCTFRYVNNAVHFQTETAVSEVAAHPVTTVLVCCV